jgi:hypothetical protein
MSTKIKDKIVGFEVAQDKADTNSTIATEAEIAARTNVVQMHERVERPEMLLGST